MVVEAGGDALGFVFYAKSPRNVDITQAADIIATLPPFVQSVALFLNPSVELVTGVIDSAQIDLLQFHGTESPDFCGGFERPYIKAVPMGGSRQGFDVYDYVQAYPDARGFLLDSNALGEAGGSGRTFDWQRYPRDLNRPLVLAGGLHPDNVAAAVAAVRPFAVDVSSGVESAPGIKDPGKIRQFIEQTTGATQ